MDDTTGRLRPLDGIVIFATSYVASIVVTALLSSTLPPRINAAVMSGVLVGIAAVFLKFTPIGQFLAVGRPRRRDINGPANGQLLQ